MTNEEIQRVMEFIIKRQEAFAEGMEQLRELHAQAETRISKLETAAVHLFNSAVDLTKAQKETETKLKGLADSIAELREAQSHTDQRVNVLIDILEQGRNGKSKDSSG